MGLLRIWTVILVTIKVCKWLAFPNYFVGKKDFFGILTLWQGNKALLITFWILITKSFKKLIVIILEYRHYKFILHRMCKASKLCRLCISLFTNELFRESCCLTLKRRRFPQEKLIKNSNLLFIMSQPPKINNNKRTWGPDYGTKLLNDTISAKRKDYQSYLTKV